MSHDVTWFLISCWRLLTVADGTEAGYTAFQRAPDLVAACVEDLEELRAEPRKKPFIVLKDVAWLKTIMDQFLDHLESNRRSYWRCFLIWTCESLLNSSPFCTVSISWFHYELLYNQSAALAFWFRSFYKKRLINWSGHECDIVWLLCDSGWALLECARISGRIPPSGSTQQSLASLSPLTCSGQLTDSQETGCNIQNLDAPKILKVIESCWRLQDAASSSYY